MIIFKKMFASFMKGFFNGAKSTIEQITDLDVLETLGFVAWFIVIMMPFICFFILLARRAA